MGFIDKFLNVMNLNPEDDEAGYYDDDYIDDEPVDEEPKKPRLFSSSKEESSTRARETSSPSKILPIRSSRKQVTEDVEVCIIKPKSIEDAREISETLLNNRTVFLNMEGVNLDVAQRIIDFTSGSCFAMGGNLQKVSNYIFILTPPNVEISGDIDDLLGSFENSPIQTDL
ncbi:MAG: cell division protein SepF [Eubacterium sp.]|nr:cell division protein SepF [Eubacterium sp.]